MVLLSCCSCIVEVKNLLLHRNCVIGKDHCYRKLDVPLTWGCRYYLTTKIKPPPKAFLKELLTEFSKRQAVLFLLHRNPKFLNISVHQVRIKFKNLKTVSNIDELFMHLYQKVCLRVFTWEQNIDKAPIELSWIVWTWTHYSYLTIWNC